MAIDTKEKRRSALHFTRKWMGPGVTPNASKDKEWRQQVLKGYSGIAVATIVILTAAVRIFVKDSLRRIFIKG